MSLPALSLEQLFDVETAVEEGWKALLVANGKDAFMQREVDGLTVPRLDIQCALGAAGGHRGQDRRKQWWLDSWAFRLTLGVVTERKDDQPKAHGLYRAQIRIIAQYGSGKLDDDKLFPFHVLTSIKEDGTAPSVVSEDDCDVSEMSFAGLVSIRSTAWPEV